MKYLLILSFIFSLNTFSKELGFTCRAEEMNKPENTIFFNIILDQNSYDKSEKTIDIFVYHQNTLDMEIIYNTVEAFYVSESSTNPQYYIRAKKIKYYNHILEFEVYPLADKMLGYTNLTITKNGKYLDGTCERADYLDSIN